MDKKTRDLTKDVRKLADQITAFNKPLFEAKLTAQERKYYEMGDDIASTSPILWNRVYAKDKTCVLARAGKDKKFKVTFFATADPELVFLGKVHVGMGTKELERFFNDSMSNMSFVRDGKTIVYGPQLDGTDGFEPEIAMFCKGGLVTEIIVDFSDFSESEELIVVSKKAEKFMSDKLKQMGFSHTEIGSVVGVNPAYQ